MNNSPSLEALSTKYCTRLISIVPEPGGNFALFTGPRRDPIGVFSAADLLTLLSDDYATLVQDAESESRHQKNLAAISETAPDPLVGSLDLGGLTL